MNTHFTEDYCCPTCGYRMNVHSTGDKEGESRGPGPGDFSICLKCGQACVYTEKPGELQIATPEDFSRMEPEQVFQIRQIQKAIQGKIAEGDWMVGEE